MLQWCLVRITPSGDPRWAANALLPLLCRGYNTHRQCQASRLCVLLACHMAPRLFVTPSSAISAALSKQHFPSTVTGTAAGPRSAISMEMCAEPCPWRTTTALLACFIRGNTFPFSFPSCANWQHLRKTRKTDYTSGRRPALNSWLPFLFATVID